MVDSVSDIKRGSSSDSNIASAVSDSKKLTKSVKNQLILGIGLFLVIVVIALFFLLRETPEPELYVNPDTFDALEHAIQTQNVTLCEELNPARKEICLNSILGDLIKNFEEKEQPADEIFKEVVESGDSSACEKISSPTLKAACLKKSS